MKKQFIVLMAGLMLATSGFAASKVEIKTATAEAQKLQELANRAKVEGRGASAKITADAALIDALKTAGVADKGLQAAFIQKMKNTPEMAETLSVMVVSKDSKGSDAATGAFALSALSGSSKTSKLLNEEEMVIARDAVKRNGELAKEGIFGEELVSYIEINSVARSLMKEANKGGESITGEEAFIMALMQVKKISKEEAVKEAGKIKDCV